MQPNEVREARRKLKMTQVQFAAAVGVSGRTIARWEAGPVPAPWRRAERIKQLVTQQKQEADTLVACTVTAGVAVVAAITFLSSLATKSDVADLRKEVAALRRQLDERKGISAFVSAQTLREDSSGRKAG